MGCGTTLYLFRIPPDLSWVLYNICTVDITNCVKWNQKHEGSLLFLINCMRQQLFGLANCQSWPPTCYLWCFQSPFWLQWDNSAIMAVWGRSPIRGRPTTTAVTWQYNFLQLLHHFPRRVTNWLSAKNHFSCLRRFILTSSVSEQTWNLSNVLHK